MKQCCSKLREPNDIKLIYVLYNDHLLASQLDEHLEQFNYRVQLFQEINQFEDAWKHEVPAAIVIVSVFSNGHIMGIELIKQLKDKLGALPPVVFISNSDDIETRIASANVGVCRYFCKPVNMGKLTLAIDGLTMDLKKTPFKVLLIDDDDCMLEYHALFLESVGMEVQALSNPLETLKVLEEFRPDVVVIDVYMPDCSGPELAQVIRQDDSWTLMPIMFLSSETDLDRQLEAMKQGGDEFLIKPVKANHLAEAITSKIKRAQRVNQLYKKLDNTLRENEFQLTTMNQHNITFTSDIQGRIISVNDRLCQESGYCRKELIGENHQIFKSHYHPKSFYNQIWKTVSGGKIWHGTICIQKKDASACWVEATIVPFLNEKGKPYKYVSALTNITALRESEERLKRSQKFANIGSWDWDILTGDLFWSDCTGALFGYTQEVPESSYDNFLAAIHPDDRQKVVDAVNNCLKNKAEYSIEHRVVWPDGSIHWLHEMGNVVRDESGKPLHMLGLVQDIDVRKHAELALKEGQEMLCALYKLSPLGIVLTDIKGHYLESNEAFHSICGYSAEELNRLDFGELTPQEYEKQESEQQEILHKSGHYGPYEKQYRQKNGHLIPIRLNGMMVKDQHGQSRIWSIVEDISASKKAESELIESRKLAEKANQAKSEFLASMSHELRTPMNAIMGFSQLLQLNSEPALSASQLKYVSEIYNAGGHLLELINEILDLSRIEAGHIDLLIEAVMLAKVIGESLELIAPLARKRGIEISLTWNDTEVTFDQLMQQKIAVKADHSRLRQVLLNLLSNAIKYNHDNGKITIACNYTENNQTRISIKDTGIGLTAEQQTQLFVAFNRLGIKQAEIEGTGVGLVITKKIIEHMGGNIGVFSEQGKGSTFWIELPDDKAPSNQKTKDDMQDKALPQLHANTEHTFKVLYIEDNPVNLRLVIQLLSLNRQSNISMLSAHEPLLGLELAKNHKPDLILLDINLPGIDGFEVLRRLRLSDVTKHIKVFALSANAMPEDIDRGLKAGFDDYITKPFEIRVFLRAIEKALHGDN